jgi:pimeloyl-ACP methyl ester carboxylesterase
MPPQMTAIASAVVPTYYRSAKVDGLNIAYREAGDPGSPKLVLHGFPASSHQYPQLDPGPGHSLPRDCARLSGIRQQ